MPLPARPALLDTLTELPRAALEATRLAWSGTGLLRRSPRGDGHPVLVLPAYGLGDLGMRPLRRFLDDVGYRSFASELGVNLDRGALRIRRIEDAARFRRVQTRRVLERIRAIQARTGDRVSLVGWSMGGLFAFDAARLAPDSVRQAITLGSPFGDPRGTALWDVMRTLNRSSVPAEAQDFSGWLTPIPADAAGPVRPVTIFYSPVDGIVGRRTARIDRCARVGHAGRRLHGIRYRPVRSSHLGFPVNPEIFLEIARALADPDPGR